MEKRKYLSEFGLHVFSSHTAMFYPADIPNVEFKEHFHIYMINLIPKIQIDITSLQQFTDHISIEVFLRTDQEIKKEKLEFAISSDINHLDLTITTDHPKKTLNIMKDRDTGLGIRALELYKSFSYEPLDMEIIYVGQSFGKGGSRKALDRLAAHSTLQKILADVAFNEEVRDVAISLWEFTPRLMASFDGISQNYFTTHEQDTVHMRRVINTEQEQNQVINITEAALINYFKPKYNDKFKHHFPLLTHNGYKYYYDLDYNSLIVELDQESLNSSLYSEHRKYEYFNSIKYGLHPENIRKSMFDIFS